MKKLLAIALGALLVVAFATAAPAATSVSFSGMYQARGFYMTNPDITPNAANENIKESYLDHQLWIDLTFKANPNVSLTTQLYALGEEMWGTTGGNYGAYAHDNPSYTGSPEFWRVFMTIKSSFGIWSVGRMAGGYQGLKINGEGGSPVGAHRFIHSTEVGRDRIKWVYPAGNFTLVALFEKNTERDAVGYGMYTTASGGPVNVAGARTLTDADLDQYAVLPIYKWKNGVFNCLFAYAHVSTPAPAAKIKQYAIVPALTLKFGGFKVNAEIFWVDGETEIPGGGGPDREARNYYIDFQYNFGPGNIGFMYTYIQGNDPTTAETEGVMNSGFDFQPLYAAFYGKWGVTSQGLQANLNAQNNFTLYYIWADYSVTEDLMLHAAYGWMKRNEVAAGISDDFGSEFDVGLSYKIMDNLEYGLHLGYFFADDWFQQGVAGAAYDDNVHFDHSLTMTF